jgi:signal transduction histidine kinase
VELIDQPQDGLPGRLVEVAGRLVGEHDGGLADQGTGDRDPLALPAGELGGTGVPTLGQADQVQGLASTLTALCEGDAGVEEPVGHVVQHGGVLGQEELLEDEPDPGGPQIGGLTIETSGDASPIVGSPALLLQMATNLVHNAIVHNLSERGTVWVTTSAHPKSVVLTVENTGKKLTPQLVATLAEPFQRGTKRIRTDHAGVGLGLAIVKSIAQAHDGALTLTPRTAGGLCVTVQLPVAPPEGGT